MNEVDLTALQGFLDLNSELILVRDTGKTFAIKTSEVEVESVAGRGLVSFLDEDGFQTWRIVEIEISGSKLVLHLSRNFQTEKTRIELIPRIKAEELTETVEIARLEKANRIAKLLVAETAGTKLVRVELNKENGRFAQIIIDQEERRVAVLSDVTEKVSPEVILSFAIMWLSKLERRKKKPIDEIWLISGKGKAKTLQKLHACLHTDWKRKIKLLEARVRNSGTTIVTQKPLPLSNLWRYKPRKLKFSRNRHLSETSREIIKLAPNKIDYLISKNGETLRYLGLPFLRVREIFGAERALFGIDRKRRVLNKDSYEDFYQFFAQLKKYRAPDTPNLYHVFYETALEAWLEGILRHNIKLLDSNLILSPIYNQFRTSRDKIDLLALRKDGRLVIIELKVSQDREMIFQAVDYWRKIELQRRKGILNDARLFGDLEITDQPTIVYLVAPALSYHPDFEFLSKTVSKEIEIFRFDLATNWRENVKVLSRKKLQL